MELLKGAGVQISMDREGWLTTTPSGLPVEEREVRGSIPE